jgi:hypothetical protein
MSQQPTSLLQPLAEINGYKQNLSGCGHQPWAQFQTCLAALRKSKLPHLYVRFAAPASLTKSFGRGNEATYVNYIKGKKMSEGFQVIAKYRKEKEAKKINPRKKIMEEEEVSEREREGEHSNCKEQNEQRRRSCMAQHSWNRTWCSWGVRNL